MGNQLYFVNTETSIKKNFAKCIRELTFRYTVLLTKEGVHNIFIWCGLSSCKGSTYRCVNFDAQIAKLNKENNNYIQMIIFPSLKITNCCSL